MRELSQTPRAVAARKAKAAREAVEYQARIQAYREHLDAHMVVRADGSEVLPGQKIESGVTFLRLTRAPGDGTGTGGKILVHDVSWSLSERELYPSVFGLKVVPRG